MTTRVHIEQAKAGQTFYGLPAHTGTPVATVNGGDPVVLKDTPGGILLTTPAAHGDIVKITFDQLIWG